MAGSYPASGHSCQMVPLEKSYEVHSEASRVPSKSPRGWRGLRWGPGFTCALALGVFLSGAAVAQDTAWQGFAAPPRMVNLNPFHLLYGVPASFRCPRDAVRLVGTDRVNGCGVASERGSFRRGSGPDGR